MASDVSKHCNRCDKCQRVNNRLGRAKLCKGRYQLRSKTGLVMKKLYSSCLLKEYLEQGTCTVPKRGGWVHKYMRAHAWV